MVLCIIFNSPNDISRAVAAAFFVHRDYLRVTSLTTDTTLSNFYAISNEKASKNNLNLTFINSKETHYDTRNLTQQDIQFLSNFVSPEVVETIRITTKESISLFHQLQEHTTKQ